MKRFIKYLASRRRTLVFFFLLGAFLWAAYRLYRLPAGAVLYPFLLAALLGLGFLLLDWRRTLRRCRILKALAETQLLEREELPVPAGPAEEAWQALTLSLYRSREALREKAAGDYGDLMDYYTLWAHQIKTPIAAMRLMLQNADSPEARSLLQELGRIERYVEMVLTYLRLDGDSTDYVIRECDLDDILRPALKKFAGEFIGRKLTLDYAPTGAKVLTDEKWLGFVVEQLLSNALKYTPSGSITVALEEPATLVVRDTGIGIAPEDLPRIFQRGYTGLRGREDKRASGIGLYLCKRICQNLGHTITAESVPGEGTTVRLDLSRRALSVE